MRLGILVLVGAVAVLWAVQPVPTCRAYLDDPGGHRLAMLHEAFLRDFSPPPEGLSERVAAACLASPRVPLREAVWAAMER